NALMLLRDQYTATVYAPPLEVVTPEVGTAGPGPETATAGARTTSDQADTQRADKEAAGNRGTEKGTVTFDWPGALESAWTRCMAAARKLVESMGHHDLHSCFGAALQACLPLGVGGGELVKVEPVQTVGDNPDYGIVTLLDWKVRERESVKGPQALRVAVGFLLAGGPGLPYDLRAKFDYLRDKFRRVRLVILWPTQKDIDP